LSFVVSIALICAAIATQRSKEPTLLAVVSAIPGAQLTPSGPLLEISLWVVGISGLSAAKSARASLNGIVGIEELPARGRMRAMVTRGRSGHLNRRPGNQDRAEDGYNCLSHLYLRQSDAPGRGNCISRRASSKSEMGHDAPRLSSHRRSELSFAPGSK
jgi:hypothetical protein